MSAVSPAAQLGHPQQAAMEAAMLVLERMSLSPADLTALPQERTAVLTAKECMCRRLPRR